MKSKLKIRDLTSTMENKKFHQIFDRYKVLKKIVVEILLILEHIKANQSFNSQKTLKTATYTPLNQILNLKKI